MLEIKNLHVNVDDKPILKNLNLTIQPGTVHAIMGPNGAGKSTLGNVLAGRKDYDITEGEILFDGENILELSPQARAALGIFLAFQYPVEIPGVSNTQFLKTAVNSLRKIRNETELDAIGFMKTLKEKMALLEMQQKFMQRGVNEGFSGGEKKRNEMLQMLMLEPALCVLDETDSGLDIDALRIVAKAANIMRNQKRSFIVITHYQRLLDYIEPDYVHVLANGHIVRSGDKSLALELEDKGYAWLKELA
ncbi:Fe-S cluster assembly ATPase SufC [Thiotrichales bacterium 19S3-7]|nr:Fe-S cluster assembly ATPase SufC [Thiotrichales bacterium 19S3-7]MCF6801418.1 Fe-S cluster assembly ATPase SufC [Thiotrichales bacterium 19S3-11]